MSSSESEGIWFVCPACGASNRPQSNSCFLCGHALDAAKAETITGPPRPPISFGSTELINPYAPPASEIARPLSFRISSLLMVIAVIAVCLGVAHENLVLGIILAMAIVPALIYTVIVVQKRGAGGNPLGVADKVTTFLVAIGGVMIVEFSSLVAFCMTCYPIGFVSVSAAGGLGLIVAFGIGGLAAIVTAVYATRLLLSARSQNQRVARRR